MVIGDTWMAARCAINIGTPAPRLGGCREIASSRHIVERDEMIGYDEIFSIDGKATDWSSCLIFEVMGCWCKTFIDNPVTTLKHFRH